MPSLREPIKGEVSRIIDKYSVILNVGRIDNVVAGMDFVIYTEGEEIYDSKGKSLGKIEHVKAKVEVVHVQERLSIAESSEFESLPTLDAISGAMTKIGGTYRKALPVSDADVLELEKTDMAVRVGDKVRQLEPTSPIEE